jgi:hypothetical protein
VRRTDGYERFSFPSAVFTGPDVSRQGVWGWRRYEAYREAALAAGARVAEERRPEPLEALERFGRCATRELEEICGKPRPVLKAELWALARDWKLKPVAVLGGTLWELP